MGITGVKMPMVWAVLAFIFNFIPNVGSMLATIMPLPIILVDSELTMFWKVLGFALPAVWNACECRNGRLGPLTVAATLTGPFLRTDIGNVLEPTLFGKSLNLTAISVFIGLVLWASLWGIPGAILSVPLLGAQKVIPTPSHVLDRISPIFPRFFPFFARFHRLDEAVPMSRRPEPRAKKQPGVQTAENTVSPG